MVIDLVDTDALAKSNKALTIIFIILIVLINVGLILKISRMPRPLFCVQKLTLISLAIGDIFVALFSLVVAAITHFDIEAFADFECSTKITAPIYNQFLLNFVYGTGLVILGIDMIVRLKQPPSQSDTSSSNNITAFFVSAIPWLLGLIIILPLTMAGMDWDSCILDGYSLSRAKAWYAVSICLPAFAALCTGVLLVCNFMGSTSYQGAVASPQIPLQNATYHNNHDPAAKPLHEPSAPPAENGQNPYPQAPNPYPSQPYAHNSPDPPPYPGTYPQPNPGSSNPPQNVTNSQPTYIPQTQSSPQTGSVTYNREKEMLMHVCIVYFVCTIPFAGLKLGYDLNEDRTIMDSLTYTILSSLSYWLMICRSAATPAIWIICLYNL